MTSLTRQVSQWLTDFGAALDRGDLTGAADMFGEDSYWRDLVSLTWNIVTLEHRDGIKAMLEATAPRAKPSRWQLEGEATLDDGVTEGWFTFETVVSRGKGHIRLKDGKCWTLLTTMVELKGFEEKAGDTREPGTQQEECPNLVYGV
jgi:putative flavoprotein involved in K+ transport